VNLGSWWPVLISGLHLGAATPHGLRLHDLASACEFTNTTGHLVQAAHRRGLHSARICLMPMRVGPFSGPRVQLQVVLQVRAAPVP
jgi:hypothetical protein